MNLGHLTSPDQLDLLLSSEQSKEVFIAKESSLIRHSSEIKNNATRIRGCLKMHQVSEVKRIIG